MKIIAITGLLLASLGYAGSSLADANKIYTQRVYQRLTGQPIRPKSHVFIRMNRFIKQKKYTDAAQIALGEKGFYHNTLVNLIAPLSNKDESKKEKFNDMQALFVGIVRDEIDARELLTADYRYEGSYNLGLPNVTMKDNSHYESFELAGHDLRYDLKRTSDQWPSLNTAAGVLTTRAWAKAHYDAGTNRRAVEKLFEVFMCTAKEKWKTRGLPDFFVRRDVDRAPSGNPETYQNHCRSCHAPMDAIGGAFAYLDFKDGQFIYYSDQVAPKMNHNDNFYPNGYVTTDNSWVSFYDRNPNLDYQFRRPSQGRGVAELGKFVSSSFGFSRCLVKRVFQQVCSEGANSKPKLVDELARRFEKQGYNLKNLFAEVAANNECIKHP